MSEPGLQLTYGVTNDWGEPAEARLAASVFADRPHVLAALIEDAEGAGLGVSCTGGLAELDLLADIAVGDILLLDVPVIDPQGIAALAALDIQLARTGASLIVFTSLNALDAVFGCLDQSKAEILVDPSRAERILAINRAKLARKTKTLHELSEEDRITLLRLSQQVDEMARRLEQLSGSMEPSDGDTGAFRFESPVVAFRHAQESGDRLVRAARPALPDPRLVRRILRQRQLRARFFEGDLFADPAWDMLLDLTAARAEHLRVSVTSLCIASAVPPTTALRWITQMTEMGLMERLNDETDRRRAFIALTDKAADAMARYFAELGSSAVKLV